MHRITISTYICVNKGSNKATYLKLQDMENVLNIGTNVELVINKIVLFCGTIISVNKDIGTYNVKCADSGRITEIHHNTIIEKYNRF